MCAKVPKEIQKVRFTAKPRHFGIGQAVPVKRDLTRYVKWPRYIRIQRQRKILNSRLKVPGQINVFRHPVDKNLRTNIVKLARKYSPETVAQKKARLAQASKESEVTTLAPQYLRFGIHNVTNLIEKKEAKLVLVAHDVVPLELVLWMPALCQRVGVTCAIIKSKSLLGELVHQKTASCVAFSSVKPEHEAELQTVIDAIKAKSSYTTLRRQVGKPVLGGKAMHKIAKVQAAIRKEADSKAKLNL
ncbi:putative multi-domain containing protein [Aduncisulcus paluster]|uniref:60S ribosomal protein L7a n=1 Tax=Aduncisulcus paluster TaxID=2918883 RepID=A0ABQ5KI62_9EUKA|nr:putative multi-domain containing protein [Aduncisulcus paluster]|eukprot:gnl/Carplike_NY0171/86_a115_7232.p2 GENE.gnl/Carplike_NY0171/86_a115_7232~~gnl/Carplike_NY0171/86_a115_7232.p2  ORF type:complete len:245 (+),score=79.15 gnl/Carplike_NY0171/86_a115_7232:69-803(+)